MKRSAVAVAALLCIGSAAASVAAQNPLTPGAPIAVPHKPGYFDYMTVDAKYRRLLVAHSAYDQLAIIDITGGSVLKQIDLGDGAGGFGVAVDVRDGKYFVGTAANKVVDVNRKYMVLQSNIALPGPVDAIAFDQQTDTLYADEDNGTRVWAINGKSDKVIATIAIPKGPEYVDVDPVGGRVYQNIKPNPSIMLAIDPTTNAIVARWPLAPATRVHGLAVDGASGRVFSIGINGKLVMVDVKSGTVVATVDVAERVDQIAFDPGNRRVYCPSGTGVMSVVQETDSGGTLLGSVSIPRGTHSVAVDPQTHDVWISYGGADSDYVERFTAAP